RRCGCLARPGCSPSNTMCSHWSPPGSAPEGWGELPTSPGSFRVYTVVVVSRTTDSAEDKQAFTPPLELFPFESRWFDTNGIRVHYVDEGGGMPTLMCHGNPAWGFMYRHAIRGLRDR